MDGHGVAMIPVVVEDGPLLPPTQASSDKRFNGTGDVKNPDYNATEAHAYSEKHNKALEPFFPELGRYEYSDARDRVQADWTLQAARRRWDVVQPAGQEPCRRSKDRPLRSDTSRNQEDCNSLAR